MPHPPHSTLAPDAQDAPASHAQTPPRLELSGVGMTYGGVGGVWGAPSTRVLRGVDLTVAAGESLAIIGPSGCGKSTLLNIIGALTPPTAPTAGGVRVDGEDIYAKNDKELASFRNTRLGFIFQSHHLLPQLSALENTLIPSLVHPDAAMRRSAPGRAKELLRSVGLGERLDHRPGQLSGGEQQRVAVARALINQPALVLADEPTGSLDEDSSDQLGDLLTSLNREHGVTLIVVTHSARLAARMERGVTLTRGRLEPAQAGGGEA